jgi:ankyrin repeat protein
VEQVRLLLARGDVDPNGRNGSGSTALHLLLYGRDPYCGNPDEYTILDALLDAGADPNVRNSAGRAPLHLLWGHNEFDPEYEASLGRRLLEAGAAADAEDGSGETPLHLVAARDGKAAAGFAAALLDAGAYVDARDARGRTPLAVAVAAGSRGLARLLLDYGASPGALPSVEAGRLADLLGTSGTGF